MITRTLNAAVLVAAAAIAAPAHAALFVEGADPTTVFDSLLLDDVTPNTGQDSSTNDFFVEARNLDIPTGLGPVDLTFTGIGFNPRGGTSTSVENVTVTLRYLGADATFNTSDDVVLGSRSATLQYNGTVTQYTAVFDEPIIGQIDGAEDRFRITLFSSGNMRFKTWNAGQSPSGQAGIKLSLGGTAIAAIPEPTAMLAFGLPAAVIGFARPRRGS